jgi:hypothetical protein
LKMPSMQKIADSIRPQLEIGCYSNSISKTLILLLRKAE